MIRYLIVHCKHEGCYDYKCLEDPVTNSKITPVTINSPKVFFFTDKEQANDFFVEYMNDVDVIDEKCKKGDDIVHQDYCTCGIIEMDDDGNTILFYNRKNQIFLLEHGAEMFMPSDSIKKDIHNINLTNKFIRNHRTLTKEQKERYIELGRVCKESMKKTATAKSSTKTATKTFKKEDGPPSP